MGNRFHHSYTESDDNRMHVTPFGPYALNKFGRFRPNCRNAYCHPVSLLLPLTSLRSWRKCRCRIIKIFWECFWYICSDESIEIRMHFRRYAVCRACGVCGYHRFHCLLSNFNSLKNVWLEAKLNISEGIDAITMIGVLVEEDKKASTVWSPF